MNPDKHHPIFERADWSRDGMSKTIRCAGSFPILMDYDVHHNELHANCHHIQFIGREALKVVMNNFEVCENPIEQMYNLIYAMNKAEIDHHIPKVQRDLAGLAIYNFEQQLPYIKYGYIKK